MKEIIFSAQAPLPVGPYSQATYAQGVLYVSGQIAIDPQSNQFMDGSVEIQTKLVLQNLHAILKAKGFDFENVVKTTISLKNIADFAVVNEIYATVFSSNPPARETVEVAALPKNALVEISCIAVG